MQGTVVYNKVNYILKTSKRCVNKFNMLQRGSIILNLISLMDNYDPRLTSSYVNDVLEDIANTSIVIIMTS